MQGPLSHHLLACKSLGVARYIAGPAPDTLFASNSCSSFLLASGPTSPVGSTIKGEADQGKVDTRCKKDSRPGGVGITHSKSHQVRVFIEQLNAWEQHLNSNDSSHADQGAVQEGQQIFGKPTGSKGTENASGAKT
jgi:hypothetical protein